MGPHSPTPIGFSAKWGAAPPHHRLDTSSATVPPFRERAPWFGGDLQTLRNVVRGTPPDLPGGERLLLPMPDGDRLAARLDRHAGPLSRPPRLRRPGPAGLAVNRTG